MSEELLQQVEGSGKRVEIDNLGWRINGGKICWENLREDFPNIQT